jgi:hypothetical protein
VIYSNLAISADPQVTHKKIYRTNVAGAVFYYVAVVTNITTTYTDVIPDASLGEACMVENTDVLPNCNIFILYNDRIYMAGDYLNPYRLYYTETLYPERYRAAYNFFDFDVAISALAKTEVGLFVFERNKRWFLIGQQPYNFSKVQQSNIEGCTNPNGVTYIGNNPVWISNYGVRTFDGSLVQNLSEKINKGLTNKNLDSATLVFDSYNNQLYVIVADS